MYDSLRMTVAREPEQQNPVFQCAGIQSTLIILI